MSRQFSENDTSKWTYRFGRGGAGDSTISSSAAVPLVKSQLANGTYSSGATSLTLASATGFAIDDLILIHQSRGETGVTVGSWELNRISNLVSTTVTTEFPLENTYIHETGARKVQVIKLTEYNNLTVNTSVDWTVPNWDSSNGHGGLLPLMVKETFTLNGQLIANGGNGSAGSSGAPAGGTGAGYAGGAALFGSNATANSGEGTHGAASASTNPSTGNAGGGGKAGSDAATTANGGGGGASASGGTGGTAGSNTTVGTGGASVGNTDLSVIMFGGGGGGGARSTTGTNEIGGGGSGAGIVMIFAKTLTLGNGAGNRISAIGGSISGCWWPGGGGGGGSVLIKCLDATLQTNKIVATGGTSTSLGSSHGGAGSTGRVHIDYANAFTGTTNPTIDTNLDISLFPPAGGAWFLV
jgi:large repetitive protein